MQQARKPREPPPLPGTRVLVVEDDVLLLMDLAAILREAGAQVSPCRTVPQALATAGKQDIDVAVLDVRIGSATVTPVARQLAERGTPFIFYTGQVENDAILAQWPGSRVIVKPAPAGTIVSAVADAVGNVEPGGKARVQRYG